MHPFPHLYQVSASGQPDGTVAVASPGLPDLVTNAPRNSTALAISGRRRRY